MPRNSLFRYFPGVPDLSVVEDFTISLFSQEMQPKFFFFLTQSHFSNLNSLLLHIILASSAVWISVDHKFTMPLWPPTLKNKMFFLCFLPSPQSGVSVITILSQAHTSATAQSINFQFTYLVFAVSMRLHNKLTHKMDAGAKGWMGSFSSHSSITAKLPLRDTMH